MNKTKSELEREVKLWQWFGHYADELILSKSWNVVFLSGLVTFLNLFISYLFFLQGDTFDYFLAGIWLILAGLWAYRFFKARKFYKKLKTTEGAFNGD